MNDLDGPPQKGSISETYQIILQWIRVNIVNDIGILALPCQIQSRLPLPLSVIRKEF
jgi:hypothetical protein